MEILTWRSLALLVSFCFFFSLFTCIVSASSTNLMSNPTQDDSIIDIDICKIVYCGKGTCHPSATDLLGFRCECDPGWKKIKIGSFEFPACLLPNCTVDLKCGHGSLPSPPPLQPLNGLNPCLINLCLDGTCERNGSDFRCQCNEGSANLFNDPKMMCFEKCSFGGDCNGIDLGFGPPASSQTPPPPTPTSGNGSPPTGFGEMLKCSRELHLLTMLILLGVSSFQF